MEGVHVKCVNWQDMHMVHVASVSKIWYSYSTRIFADTWPSYILRWVFISMPHAIGYENHGYICHQGNQTLSAPHGSGQATSRKQIIWAESWNGGSRWLLGVNKNTHKNIAEAEIFFSFFLVYGGLAPVKMGKHEGTAHFDWGCKREQPMGQTWRRMDR